MELPISQSITVNIAIGNFVQEVGTIRLEHIQNSTSTSPGIITTTSAITTTTTSASGIIATTNSASGINSCLCHICLCILTVVISRALITYAEL